MDIISTVNIPKWEMFEVSFCSDIKYDNLFLQVDLCAVFDNGCEKYIIDGFYDGEKDEKHVWKVRFAPMKEGNWTYRTISNDEYLSNNEGCFECTTHVSRGGLAVNYQHPNWFFRADGKPFWVVNDGWTPHPGFDNKSEYGDFIFDYPTEDEWKVYLDMLSKYRVNMIIEVDQLYARQDYITDETFNWPWEVVDAKSNKIDKDRFNVGYFKRLDRMLAYAKEREIFYGVELMFDNSIFRAMEWSHHPVNIKNGGWLDSAPGEDHGFGSFFDLKNSIHMEYMERYMRYMIARTGAYWNVYYALGAECGNIAHSKAAEFSDWYGYWGDYIACKIPYGRLTSIGDTGECEDLVRHSRNNLLMTQEHTSMNDLDVFCSNINRFGERFWKYGRPTFIGEQDRYNNNRYETERRGYWVAFSSGFHMGRVDRHYDVAENGKLYECILFNIEGDPDIYKYLLNMTSFIEKSGIKYWNMSPNDSLLLNCDKNIFCLANPVSEYMVYFVNGGSCKIDLPCCSYNVKWFNTRTGEFMASEKTVGGSRIKFTAPDSEDWTLHIALDL